MLIHSINSVYKAVGHNRSGLVIKPLLPKIVSEKVVLIISNIFFFLKHTFLKRFFRLVNKYIYI